MLRSSRIRWLAAAGMVLFLLLVGWIFVEARQAEQAADPAVARRHGQPIPVRTAFAQEAEVEDVAGATALTIPSLSASIRIGPSKNMSTNSPVAEVFIKQVHVHEGSPVTQGQLLVEVDDDGLTQVVQQKEVVLAAAKAELNRVREQVPLNQRVRELDLVAGKEALKFRNEDLDNRKNGYDISYKLYRDRASNTLDYWESRSKLAQAQYTLTESTYNLQRIEDASKLGELMDQRDLARAQTTYESARLELELAGRDLERCQIRSPFTGWVSKMTAVPGGVVGVTEQMAEIVKLDPVHIKLDYPQEKLDQVALGQNAEITLDSFPQETFAGKVIRILPKVNPNLRVLPVIVELNNSSNRIKAGLSGFVRLKSMRKAVTVPALAVQKEGNKAVVFRVTEGRAHVCDVTLGAILPNGNAEIRSGIQAGDEVVIYQSNFYKNYGRVASRQAFLQDNDLVDTNWRKWARRDE